MFTSPGANDKPLSVASGAREGSGGKALVDAGPRDGPLGPFIAPFLGQEAPQPESAPQPLSSPVLRLPRAGSEQKPSVPGQRRKVPPGPPPPCRSCTPSTGLHGNPLPQPLIAPWGPGVPGTKAIARTTGLVPGRLVSLQLVAGGVGGFASPCRFLPGGRKEGLAGQGAMETSIC